MKTPRPDFDAIKTSADLAQVIAGYGIELKKQGADLVGLCPFHEDTKPSLHLTPAKQLWHCPACGAGGNVIQFVARRDGLSEKEAALQLLARLPGVTRGSEMEATGASNITPPACDPLAHSELFAAIINHYHECLLGSGKGGKSGLDYLKKRGLGSVEMLAHFKLGYVDGSLKKKLSPAQLKAAQQCGLINERGNEKFYQRIVVPIFDAQNRPVGLYGRDTTNSSNVAHLYLAGNHRAVWNAQAAHVYPDNLIVTEAILDALALWIAGNPNVIACYGAGGWTPHHTALLESAATRRVTFAFDADAAGEARARQHAQALDAQGIACHLLEWPQGVHDANDYFLYEQKTGFRGTAESFATLLTKAPRFAHHREPQANPSSPSRSSSSPEKPPRLTLTERSDEAVTFQNGVLHYRIKGLSTAGHLRIILTAANDTARHVDQLDLYAARARRGFATACAERLSLEADKIEGDLLALVEALESLQHETRTATTSAAPIVPATPAQTAAALEWLAAPDLLERIAADLERLGYVGEPRNKKLTYLIATSRLLPKPLSGIFRAQSGCGKSYLMECVAELMPPEEVHYFSRLTPQALYYLEADALKHKLLIVDERDGSEESEYPIRTLQTRRVLKLAVPLKDPNSGKIKTTVLEIHGPIAYMESTTDAHINPENANRCFELYLDESEAQTQAIFAAQRRSRTLDGWRNERSKAQLMEAHHHAQRLLRPLKVIIPYVHHIEFPAAWLRGRRDNDRFLSLIEGIAFLHQHQRKIGSENGADYIEANVEDYAIAHDLAHQVFAQAGSDIPKPVADFLTQMDTAMRDAATAAKQDIARFTFSRRDVREAVQLPDYLVKLYMRQVEELEMIEVQRATRGSSFRYRLVEQRDSRATLQGLTSPAELAQKWKSGTKVEVSENPTQTIDEQAFDPTSGSGTGTLERKKVSP